MEEVLQYILSNRTIFIFYLEDMEGGLRLNVDFLSLRWNFIWDRPKILFGPSCSIPMKFHFFG